VDKWSAEDMGFNGQEFMKTFQSIQNIPICRGCLKGGWQNRLRNQNLRFEQETVRLHGMQRDKDVQRPRITAKSAHRRPSSGHAGQD